MTRSALGCAFTFAAVPFVVALVLFALLSGFNLAVSVGSALGISGILFVAVFVLAMKDSLSQYVTRRRVRSKLLASGLANDEEFAERYPQVTPGLMHEIRESIALFFNVPKLSIRAHHSLDGDLRLPVFGPALGFFAIGRALDARGLQPAELIKFSEYISDFREFAQQIEIAIEEAKHATLETEPGEKLGN